MHSITVYFSIHVCIVCSLLCSTCVW